MTLIDAKDNPAIRSLFQGLCTGTLDMESVLYGVLDLYPDMTLAQFTELHEAMQQEFFE